MRWRASLEPGNAPPRTVMLPAVGAVRPTARCRSVVLPAPLGADQGNDALRRDRQGAAVECPGAPVAFGHGSGLDRVHDAATLWPGPWSRGAFPSDGFRVRSCRAVANRAGIPAGARPASRAVASRRA